ncbi:MAG: cupin domain-containing protein [Saprospiraceae bacterium]|nr:cupin domain-containing protein [Saprospiraceae bacterium]
MKIVYLLLISHIMLNAQSEEVRSGVYRWAELPVKLSKDRESRKIMEGTSPHFDYLEIHATTQAPGATPAPPHAQTDIEEVIIVKEGTMKFTMDGEESILGPGSVILIPPLAMQALQNVGDGPLTYYVMMFRSKKPMDIERGKVAGGHLFVTADQLEFTPNDKGGRTQYFDRATAMCEQFHMHVTSLDHKGPSMDPHSHIDSEIFLVIEGETELLLDGERIRASAGDLYFIKAHQLHGMSNASEKPCRFFAFKWR